jgi:hypothetical protein
VDNRLIDHAATGESSGEAIEDRKELGAASPLRQVELAENVEAPEGGRASDGLMHHAFGREAVGGDTEVPTEL